MPAGHAEGCFAISCADGANKKVLQSASTCKIPITTHEVSMLTIMTRLEGLHVGLPGAPAQALSRPPRLCVDGLWGGCLQCKLYENNDL